VCSQERAISDTSAALGDGNTQTGSRQDRRLAASLPFSDENEGTVKPYGISDGTADLTAGVKGQSITCGTFCKRIGVVCQLHPALVQPE